MRNEETIRRGNVARRRLEELYQWWKTLTAAKRANDQVLAEAPGEIGLVASCSGLLQRERKKVLDAAAGIAREAIAEGHRCKLVEENFPLIEKVYEGDPLSEPVGGVTNVHS